MNTKMKQAKKYALPLVIVIAVLLAFSSPAAADYSGDKPLTIYEHGMTTGGLIFVTDETGDYYTKLYSDPDPDFGYPCMMTQDITIEIPDGATVKTARLYNTYCWSTSNFNDPDVPGLPAQVELTFSDGTTTVTQICDHGYDGINEWEQIKEVPNPIYCGDDCVHYWDTKNASKYPPPRPQGWDYPSGEFAWNVTGMVTGSGTYTATIENIENRMVYTPTDNERFVTFGFGLLVVYEYEYEHPDSSFIEYWIAEGCDSLLHNAGCPGCIWETWENATSYTTFSGVSSATAENVTLTTVLTCSQGGLMDPPTNMVYFNGEEIGPSTAAGDQHYGVNYFNVPTLPGDNVVGFQDRGDCEYVHNAFLVVKREGIPDTTPPDISVIVSPDTLRPPNHKMVDIVATVTVSDDYDQNPGVILTSVTSDEPDNAQGPNWDINEGTSGDGNTVNDIQGANTGTEDYEFQLRAERSGEGDGRVYTITYTATDASGNSASASATVVVPQ